MRQLIRTYKITGDHQITISNYSFTKEDVRLIINESLASTDKLSSVLVSSTAKDNIISVNDGVITLSDKTASLKSTDILTIEIDVDNVAKESTVISQAQALSQQMLDNTGDLAKELTNQEILSEIGNIDDALDGLNGENLPFDFVSDYAKQGDNPNATMTGLLDAINAISPDLMQGKARLATAITSKGVETTSADSLSQMAENVKAITYADIIEAISSINESVTILNDPNKGWTLTNNASYLLTLYPNLKELHFGFTNYTTAVLFLTTDVVGDIANSYDIDIIFDEIETLDIRYTGVKDFISNGTAGSGVKGARCYFPKLQTIYFPGNYANRINVEKVYFPVLKSGTYFYSGSGSYSRTLIHYIYIGCMGEKTDTISIQSYGQNRSEVNNIIIELRDGACQNLSFEPQVNVVTLTEDNICTYILKKLKQDEPLCGDGVTITFGAANLANLTSDESIELLDKLTNIYGYTFA